MDDDERVVRVVENVLVMVYYFDVIVEDYEVYDEVVKRFCNSNIKGKIMGKEGIKDNKK